MLSSRSKTGRWPGHQGNVDQDRREGRRPRNRRNGVVTISSDKVEIIKVQPASVFQDRLGGITSWQSPRNIRQASIIIRPPLNTTLPPIIIIKPLTIMILASTKRRRSTRTLLTNIASRHTSIPRLPTNTLINDELRRWRRCRLLLLVMTDLGQNVVVAGQSVLLVGPFSQKALQFRGMNSGPTFG